VPIRRIGGETNVASINGFGSGTKVKRVTVGRPISNVVQNIGANIKTFDGLGDIPSIEELKLGEIGINTQDGKLYIKREYDGGIQTIVEIGAVGDDSLSATTTFNAYIYTSDGTLEIITGADDSGNVLQYDPDPNSPSRIQVYLNGVLLHQGIDYVANDGSTISLTHVVDDEQVVQVAAYNSTGVSFGNDLILDDHFAFIVGTNEETRFYHNGTDTIVKHLGFNDSKFKIQHENTDRFVMDTSGVQLFGNYTLNGQSVSTQTEVDDLHARINDLDSDLQEVTELLQELLQFRQ
jgi:hypothetical protein